MRLTGRGWVYALMILPWVETGLFSFNPVFAHPGLHSVPFRSSVHQAGFSVCGVSGGVGQEGERTSGSSPPSGFNQEELDRMARGEVVSGLDKLPGSQKGMVNAAIMINAPAELIWGSMTDCFHAPEFIPGLISCKVLEDHGETEIIEHQVKFSWFIPTLTYVFRAVYEKNRRIDFKRIGGNLKEFEGSWILEPVGDGRQTVVLYSVYLDPGFFLPQWLIQMFLRRDLSGLLLALRSRVLESKDSH
jgi:ribosome-associated toxin RatA of RatAB toxin-antitoxin module